MSEAKYNNQGQERGYKVLLLLAGHEFSGVSPSELSKALDTLPANITRDLHILQKAGLAEPLPYDTRKWRLGPKIVQIANAFKAHLSEVQRRADEIEQRYTRAPN